MPQVSEALQNSAIALDTAPFAPGSTMSKANLVVWVSLLAFFSTAAFADPFPTTQPEKVGMSSDRLRHLTAVLQTEVDGHRLPGAVLAVARKGQLVYFEALGFRDTEARVAMPRDAIFSIASMTKPMVSVAVMMLYEEGKLLLSDPIGKYLPLLANMRVLSSETDEVGIASQTVPAERQPTIHDLLTHMSGLGYEATRLPAQQRWPASSALASRMYTADEFVRVLSKAALLHQPGRFWDYGLSTDVLGIIVEIVSGTSLENFLHERLWQPLEMVDTSFGVPESKRARYALPFPNDPLTGNPQSALHASRDPLKFECGGGCAVSTAMDYLRFAQMLAGKGAFGGQRFLSRKTMELMTSDQLTQEARERRVSTVLADGYSFGLGFSVRTQTGAALWPSSIGDFGWGGASGTHFWVDPQEELVVVFMAATPSEIRARVRMLVRNLVWASISDREKRPASLH